jgi:hypothetical protein
LPGDAGKATPGMMPDGEMHVAFPPVNFLL